MNAHAPDEAIPPFPFRHRMIPAVHEAVPRWFDARGSALAAAYAAVTAAAVGAALAPEGAPYVVQAGRVVVRIRPGLEIEPATDDPAGFSYHAWAGRTHASGRVEIADLSTRHFNEWAVRAGIALEARIPRAVWAWEDELPGAFRYAAEPELAGRVRASLREAHGAALEEAVREVLARLGDDRA